MPIRRIDIRVVEHGVDPRISHNSNDGLLGGRNGREMWIDIIGYAPGMISRQMKAGSGEEPHGQRAEFSTLQSA